MGWSSQHKQLTRERIVRCASRLFTRLGFEHVGIDDVMSAAGLTRGAFYAHFQSKSELYAEAIVSGAIAAKECVTETLPNDHSIEQLAERYLSVAHRSGLTDSCPLAFLTTDIHQRDEQVRSAYTRVFAGFVNVIEQAGELDRAAAIRTSVLMIGGLAIARALNDERLSNELLSSCLGGVQALSKATVDPEEVQVAEG